MQEEQKSRAERIFKNKVTVETLENYGGEQSKSNTMDVNDYTSGNFKDKYRVMDSNSEQESSINDATTKKMDEYSDMNSPEPRGSNSHSPERIYNYKDPKTNKWVTKYD